MSGVLTKGRNLDTQTGEMPCEDEGRKLRDTPTSQGTQRLLGSHQQPGERQETGSPFQLSEGTHSTNTLSSDFYTPELWDHIFLLFYALQSVGRHTLTCTQKGLFVFSKPCSILLPFPNLFGVTFLFTYAYRISHDHSWLAHRWFPCKFCKIPRWNNLFPLSSF